MAVGFASARRYALPLAAAAAILLVSCCVVLWHSSGMIGETKTSEMLQTWQPHVGKLTEMVRSSRARSEARQQSLEEVRPEEEAHRGRTGRYASSWAQRMLSLGDSKSTAEQSDRTSLVTRGYSNTHPHFTTDVRESSASGEEDAYNFANMITRHRDAREMSQVGPAREQQLADVPASMQGPRSTAVREDRAEHDSRAWSFANGLHKPALAQRTSLGGPKTSAVREDRSSSEQSAWTWAANYFRGHHHLHENVSREPAAVSKKAAAHARMPQKAQVKEEPAVKEHPIAAVKEAQHAVHKQHLALHAAAAAVHKSLRQRKVEAAQKSRQDLHESTLELEHDKFAKKQLQEQRRVREIAAREAASERAADEGAAAEFEEYGAIASGGVPNGGRSELSEAKSGYGDMETVLARREKQREEAQETAKRVAAVAVEAKQMAKAEEEGYQKGYLAGVEAERTQEGEDSQAWKAGAADRAVKRAQAEKKREEKEARTQDLRDDTWNDADSDFQVDGGQWGPAAGDWA